MITLDLIFKREAFFRARISVRENGCHIWTGGTSGDGYGDVHIGYTEAGRRLKIPAHRMAWMLQHNRLLYPTEVIRHACDTPLCANPAHLVIGTHPDNVADRVERGRSALGEDNGRSVLSSKDVFDIRQVFSDLVKTLADKYDVDRQTIRLLLQGKTWKTVGIDG